MKRLAEMTGPELRSLLNSVAKATRLLLPPGTAFVEGGRGSDTMT